MKPGDFVQVDYVGRIKDTGEVFDLTKKDVAKKENIFNPKFLYKPVVLIVGSDFIIKGLDEALKSMKVGEKKSVDIPVEKGFGERKPDLIKTIPLSKFKEQDTKPYPGAVVSVGNLKGRVVSVDGGRVKIDFNHPLAGKTLEYELEIKSEVKERPEKIKAIFKYFTGIDEVEVICKQKTAEITIKKDVDITRPIKKMVSNSIMKWCGIEKVKIVEMFEKESEGKGVVEK
jgi:FKBP-type peptidyl-prolyl cis-trans isomerase 2